MRWGHACIPVGREGEKMAEYRESEGAGSPAPAEASEARGGVMSWIVGVFSEPTATFESIASRVAVPDPTEAGKTKDKSKWWLPILILLVAFTAMTTYVMFTPQGVELVREQMAAQGQTGVPPEQAMVMARTIGIPIQMIVMGIVLFVWAFAGGGVIHVLSRALGGKGIFRHGRAAIAWPMIIGALGIVVRAILMAVTGNVELEMSPSLFLGHLERTDTLYRFLNAGFDIFMIWETVVIVLAIAAMYRISRGKAVVPALVVWALITALMTFSPQGGGIGGM
jgi:hypothetical protein